MGVDLSKMPEDLLNTPSERAALKATIHQNSEAFLRQLCLNRGLETYNKTRSDLEQMVINLINAMDDANIGATQAAPGGKNFAPAEPVDDLSVHIDEGLVYDRTLDQEATWQQRFIIEAREDKEQIESLQAELEIHRAKAISDERKARETNNLGITMDQAQHRLKELWGIAETEASDRLAFFSDLESLVQPTPEVLSRYDQEISRLSEMLPLVDCVSRRDFVLHRLRESLKHQQHGSMQAEKLQQSEFAQELKRLNQQLSQALTTFEKRYSRRFLWKGEYILEHIQADLGQQIQASKLHAAHSVLDQIAANHGVQGAQPAYTSRSAAPSQPGRHLRPTMQPSRVLSPRAQEAMDRARTQRELAHGALGATVNNSSNMLSQSHMSASASRVGGDSMGRTMSPSRSAMRASPSGSRRSWR